MQNSKPNLVYVFADQLRYASLGYNGDENAKTPNIDKIADECEIVDNCVSGHPVCAPYRASLFTGKYTTSTGMVINEIRIGTKHKTFADVLNNHGYETCYIGKWHLYANQLGNHYDVKNSFVPKGRDRLGFNDTFAHYNFHHEYYAPKAYYHLDSNEKIYCKGYEPKFMTDYAIDNLERLSKGEKPFAMFLSLGTPHDPWIKENVPYEYLERFKDRTFSYPVNYEDKNDPHADMWARLSPKERKELPEWMRVYYAMVSELDENIGRIYKKIEDLGILDNTVFVFTSDHGEMFGAHGRRAKNIFYDEAVRVPFLIKYGDSLKKGRKDFCFNTVDIMPSLLSLMGMECPSQVQGMNLSECIKGNADNDSGSLMMGTGPTAIYGNGFEWRAIRNKRFTYAVYRRDKKEFLFDNIEDKYQMNNLCDNPEYLEIKEKLKTEMHDEMKRIGDDFHSNMWYKHHIVKKRVIQI